jgi:hypothetical protein
MPIEEDDTAESDTVEPDNDHADTVDTQYSSRYSHPQPSISPDDSESEEVDT